MDQSKIYEYKGKLYHYYLREGNAVKYISDIARYYCNGNGLDIGGTTEWSFPGAQIVNIIYDDVDHDAYSIPPDRYDYIFSSHCLEHLHDPVTALIYWKSHLKPGGCMFLYLPHPDMEYWLPQNCRKHKHLWTPGDMVKIARDIGLTNVISSERDMYWSYTVVGWNGN